MSASADPPERAALARRPRRRAWCAGILAGLAGLLLAAVPVTAQHGPRQPEAPVRLEVRARPIEGFHVRDPRRRQFGALEFRGGLELTADDKRFGGFSGLRVSSDGERFLAVSDRGRWLHGRIVYRGRVPVALADVEMAPVLGPDGRPLAARGWYDTEALGEEGGTVWVGIERVHRIVRFDFARHGVMARARPVSAPAELATLPSNRGIESLVPVPKGSAALGGALIAISEAGLDADGNIRGFIIGGPTPGAFSVLRRDGFNISDATLLPPRDLLLLERRFSYLSGIAIRLRRVPLAQIRPGALVDGPVLMEADMGFQVDNMEGLSVHRTAQGETVLTMISDDNFSPLQRTLLLQFTLVER